MSKTKIFITSLFAILTAIIIIGAVCFGCIKNSIYSSYGETGRIKEFSIKSGEGVKSVSWRLENEGLISSDFAFQIYVWQHSAGGKIKAGSYEIPTGMNIPAILDMLVGGKVKLDTVRITIPEGYNINQIVNKVQSSPLKADPPWAENFKAQISGNLGNLAKNNFKNLDKEYWFLKDNKVKTLEGYLFPDTYEFKTNADAENVVEKMLDNFERKIDPLKGQIESSKMSLYEILTLASIVEKEVSSMDDMQIVAGLFLHRLEIGMFLQSDATVNYITQKGDPTPSYKDLEADSPYNTYKYAGLPSGPICNPGINAIKAVLDPVKTDYLFFLTPPNHATVYSKTLAEHEANKRKWLK